MNEWCQDFGGSTPSTPQFDPTGATTGTSHVAWGGTFSHAADICEIGRRNDTYSLNFLSPALGFRIAAPAESVAVTGFTLDKSTLSLSAGGATGTLVATIAPAGIINKSALWFTSDATVATVSSTGVVTPLAVGTTTIMARSAADVSKLATCVVTVNTATLTYAIGNAGPAGGLVFYDQGSVINGWRYLECAPTDQSSAIQWYNGTYPTIITSTAIGSGQANTAAIISAQGIGSYAASLCDDLEFGGYINWFLPSKDELHLMYTELYSVGLGGFADSQTSYWSSSIFGSTNSGSAWAESFFGPVQSNANPMLALRVRAIHSF